MNDEVVRLTQLLEKIRKRIYTSLDAAGGNQQDPTYQRLSNAFDQALVQYMKAVENMPRT